MPIRLFHLTYDAAKSKYPNAMEDVIEVLCGTCFVTEIGHPAESTFVFKMESAGYDVEKTREALIARFPKDFCFIVSRVDYTTKYGTDSIIKHITVKPGKEHTDAFPAVLQKLKDAKKISADVRNLVM